MRCARALVLSCSRALVLSCSRALASTVCKVLYIYIYINSRHHNIIYSLEKQIMNNDHPRHSLHSWTPLTSHLLQHEGLAFDIIDRALGPTMPSRIQEELDLLRQDGLIGDLRQAKTAMEAQSDSLMKMVGLGDVRIGASTGENVRGDRSTFISRSLHRPGENDRHHNFRMRCPSLFHLIQSVEDTAVKEMAGINFDRKLTSVQAATYPGDGNSGYRRHCDRGDRCLSEPFEGKAASASSKRIITAVYYVTPEDWDSELDGGALRLFPPRSATSSTTDCTCDCRQFHDVTPYRDRLVVFRSDLVEHEVLPSLRRARTALTVWLYGHFRKENEPAPRKRTSDGIPDVPIASQSDLPPLPLPLVTQLQDKSSRIFVSIPSYRDPETHSTISSLYETAQNPERIFIGVVWQVDTSTANADECCFRPELPQPWSVTNVRAITLDYRDATGPCLARALAQTLHRQEEYILQIDSHMRFRENWDVYLLNQLSKCSCPEKSVLTTYPAGYRLSKGGKAEIVDNETRGTILVPWKFGEDGMLRQKGRLLKEHVYATSGPSNGVTNDNIPCYLYAAGFNFSSSSVMASCPYDANLHHLFFGEELSMAVRLFTHGYECFAPPESVCYHLWSRAHRATLQEDRAQRIETIEQKYRERSHRLVSNQLLGKSQCLGKVGTAADFARKLGVDFEAKIINPGSEDGSVDPDAFASGFICDESEEDGPIDQVVKEDIMNLVSAFL